MTAPASFNLKGLSTWSYPTAGTLEALNGLIAKVGKNEEEVCVFRTGAWADHRRRCGGYACDGGRHPEPANTEQFTFVIAVLGLRVTTHLRVVELVTKHIRDVQHMNMANAFEDVTRRMKSISPQPVASASPLPAGKPPQRVPSVNPMQQIDARMTYYYDSESRHMVPAGLGDKGPFYAVDLVSGTLVRCETQPRGSSESAEVQAMRDEMADHYKSSGAVLELGSA